MTDSHRAGHVVQNVLIEHSADQTDILVAVDHAVFVYGDTGSLLTAVRQDSDKKRLKNEISYFKKKQHSV